VINFYQPQNFSRLIGAFAFLLGLALPISTAADNIFAGVIVVAWLLSGDWTGKFERLRRNPGALIAGTLLLLALAGLFWSPGSLKDNLKYFEKYASILLLLCLATLPIALVDRRRAMLGFALGVVVTAVASYGFGLGVLPGEWFPGKLQDDPSPFKLHITHGFFVALGAFVLFLRAFEEEQKALRLGYWVLAILVALNALYVQGRTGHLVLATLLAYWFAQRFRWRGVAFFVVAIGLAVIVALQFPESRLTSRIMLAINEVQAWYGGSQEATSLGVRMQWAVNSLKIIGEHPWFGVGTGGFAAAYREVATEGMQLTNNPHNQYFLTAAQLGLPGLALLLAMFAAFWRQSAFLTGNEQLLARGLLLAYLVGNVFNSFLYDHSEARLFAWSIGLLFCLGSVRSAGLLVDGVSPR
jgi:O-antigen ligase